MVVGGDRVVAGAAVVVGTSLRIPSIVVTFGKALSVVVSSVDRSVGFYYYVIISLGGRIKLFDNLFRFYIRYRTVYYI